jgi:hypothetical protein
MIRYGPAMLPGASPGGARSSGQPELLGDVSWVRTKQTPAQPQRERLECKRDPAAPEDLHGPVGPLVHQVQRP